MELDDDVAATAQSASSFSELLRAAATAQGDGEQAPELVAHLYRLPVSKPSFGIGEGGGVAQEQQAIAIAFEKFLQLESQAYIWHTGHPPTVSAGQGAASAALFTLRLQTPVTAPDTDEWYALHLIFKFVVTHLQSSANGHEMYAVQTTDSDGDFVLIQGADELPDWIEPDNAQNRVWLLPPSKTEAARGPSQSMYAYASLHLIGPDLARLPEDDAATSSALTVPAALSILASPDARAASLSSSALQNAALEPLLAFGTTMAGTSSQPYTNVHSTLAYLPSAKVAALLQQEPQLCAQALAALEGLSADPVDRRTIARMERFGPLLVQPPPAPTRTAETGGPSSRESSTKPSGDQAVLAVVPLTQALYALALHLVFFPPKPHFPQHWRDAVATYRNGSSSAPMQPQDAGTASKAKIVEIDEEADRREREAALETQRQTEEGRWRDIGAKLICGLELLFARGREQTRRKSTARPASGAGTASDLDAQKLDELRHSPQYEGFIRSLTSYGYFVSTSSGQPLLQGSREWYQLEQQALENWTEQRSSVSSDGVSPKNTSGPESKDSLAARFELAAVPALIDAYVPKDSTSGASAFTNPTTPTIAPRKGDIILADPKAPLSHLLRLESPKDWLEEIQRQGDADAEDRTNGSFGSRAAGQGSGDAEDDALERLQKLMQGTTDFVEAGEGDYRGAMFSDEQGDLAAGDGEEDDDDDDDVSMDGSDSSVDTSNNGGDDGEASSDAKADASARRRARSQLRRLAPAERARRMGELVGSVAPAEWGAKAAAATQLDGGASADALRAKAREEVQKLRKMEGRAHEDAEASATSDSAMQEPGGPVSGRPSEDERAASQARQRHADLASALDAIPRSKLAATSEPDIRPSGSEGPELAVSARTSTGGPDAPEHRRLVQEQLQADVKLLRRDKHDGVSEDEESSDEEDVGAMSTSNVAGPAAQGAREDPTERAARERKLKLHELPVTPSWDADDVSASNSLQGFSRQAKDLDQGEVENDAEPPAIPDGPGIGPEGQERGDDEMANFLDFTRKELGIDDALWDRIQADRRRDGRYLPPAGKEAQESGGGASAKSSSADAAKKVRFDGLARGFLNGAGSKRPAMAPSSRDKANASSLWTATPDSDEETDTGAGTDAKAPAAGDDGFYALMDQMDAELAKAKSGQQGPRPSRAPVSTTARARGGDAMDLDMPDDEDDEDDDDDDELSAQDAELLRKLVSGQGDALRQELGLPPPTGPGATAGGVVDEDAELSGAMLANFLKSLQAQGGAPGPVSNLAGRLGVGRLPRDESS